METYQPYHSTGGPVISARTAAWHPTVASLIRSTYPRVNDPFSMAWMQMESDGNPGAVGDPGSIAADGNPREIGLGQLYNPDDFKAFGVTAAPFRAYLPDAAPLAGQYLAAKAINDKVKMNQIARTMQTPTRPLTDAEKVAQVQYTLLAKIDQCISKVNDVEKKYAITWSTSSPDYWKLVKAPHALPGILNQGMPAVVQKLGRAPSSWKEFRTALGMDVYVKNDAGQDVPKFSQWVRALNACEKCGDAVAPLVA